MSKDEKKSSGGLLTAMVAGVFGALAGAAAVFFSNKDNRDNLTKSVNKIVKQGKQKAGQLQDKLEDLSEEAKKQLADELEKTSKKLSR